MGWTDLALVACVLVTVPGCVWGKLCCDQDCRHPVSYGRTVQRYITRDDGFLSYPASAIVTIFGKAALSNDKGEYWEAEIQGKRGLILNNALKELTFKCEPTVRVGEEESGEDSHILEDGTPGVGTVPTGHADKDDTPTPLDRREGSGDEFKQDQYQPPSDIVQSLPDPRQPPPDLRQPPPDPHQSPPDLRQPPPNTRQPPPDLRQPPPNTHQPPPDLRQPPPNTHQPPPDPHQPPPDSWTTPEQLKPPVDDPRLKASENQQVVPPGDGKHETEEEKEESPPSGQYGGAEEGNSDDFGLKEKTSQDNPQISPEPTATFTSTLESVEYTPVATPPTDHASPQEDSEKEDLPTKVEYQPSTDYTHEPLEEDFKPSTPPNDANSFKGNLESDEPASVESPPQEPPTPGGQSAPNGEPPKRQVVFSKEDDDRYWDDVDEDDWYDEEDEEDDISDKEENEELFEEQLSEQDKLEDERSDTTASPPSPAPTVSTERWESIEEPSNEPSVAEESAPLPPVIPTEPGSDPLTPDDRLESDPSTTGDTEATLESAHSSVDDEKREVWKSETDTSRGAGNEEGSEADQKEEDEGSDDSHVEKDEVPVEEATRKLEEEEWRREHAKKFEEMQQLYLEQQEARRQQELMQQQFQQQENERQEDERPPDNVHQHQEHQWTDEDDQYTTTFIEQQTTVIDEQPAPTATIEDVTTPVLQAMPTQPETAPPVESDARFEAHTPLRKADCDCPHVTPPPCYCPVVAPPSPCICQDVATPPCPKVGVVEYIPLPGSESGFLWYVEQYRAYVRETVFASLPESLAEWIVENRPMLGVVCVTVGFVSLSVPLLLIMCLSCCSGQGVKKQVHSEKAARVRLEGEKVKLEGERNDLDHRLRESKTTCQAVEDELRLVRGEMDQFVQAKKQLEAKSQATAESLATSQQELSQYQTYAEQLNAQVTTLNSQLEDTAQQRDEGLKKVEELNCFVSDLQNHLKGSEAQKEQLEQDKFTTQGALDALQTEHDETTRELAELREQFSVIDAKLGTVTSELESCRVTLRDKDDEVTHLKGCLTQLTDQVAESAVDGEVDGSEAQLAKIKAMLDTSKAQQELQRVETERDGHLAQLQEKTSQLEQQTADNEALREQLSQLELKERSTVQELKELQIKMKGVTEYFQEKESDLHRKIELGEINQQRFRSLESEAQEKAAASEQEREREKEELKDLRKQMADIEKSFLSQLKSNEERAEDALMQLRRTEQDLRQANREVTTLRKKLAEAEAAAVRPPPMARPIPRPHPYPPPQQRSRPPSTGPLGPAPQGPSPQPPRPVSAPRLEPRTSSPTNESMTGAPPQEGEMHKSHSFSLNNSLPPMSGPRSQSELPARRGSSESVPSLTSGPPRSSRPRDQVPPGPLPKLDEHPHHPPQQYRVPPYPTDTPLGQRPAMPQAPPPTGPPMSHDRGYPPPDGSKRPYPPARPPYGAPPTSRGPPRPNYHPPPPGPRPPRPGYAPPRQPMPGQPRPPPMQRGQMPGKLTRPPVHMTAGPPPGARQPSAHQTTNSDFGV